MLYFLTLHLLLTRTEESHCRGFQTRSPPITQGDFIVALIKFVISNKLPMSLVEDPSFQSLLNIAQSAHTDDIIKLPKKDSFKSKVCQ